MARPKTTDARIRELYAQHGGNLREMSVASGIKYGTLRSRCSDLGLRGKGKGGTRSERPPDEELLQVYRELGGNFTAIGKRYGRGQPTVSQWYNHLGLAGQGHKYSPRYPREIKIDLPNGTVVAFSDCHWWTREKTRAHQALMVYLKRYRPDVVIANGDVLDGARISRHDPSGLQEVPSLEDELHVCREHMAEIKRTSGADCYFNLGNHDARLASYAASNASELADLDEIHLDNQILGWQFAWSNRISDQLLIMHRFRGGIHATYNNALHSGMSIATGHLHAQRITPHTDARGTRWGVDLGCLADPTGHQFTYTEANPLNWRSGFAVFEFRSGKLQPPQLVTVLDDGAVVMQKNERLL